MDNRTAMELAVLRSELADAKADADRLRDELARVKREREAYRDESEYWQRAHAAMLGRGMCRIGCVKHGDEYNVWACSGCGFEYREYPEIYCTNVWALRYCPNCGRLVVDE